MHHFAWPTSSIEQVGEVQQVKRFENAGARGVDAQTPRTFVSRSGQWPFWLKLRLFMTALLARVRQFTCGCCAFVSHGSSWGGTGHSSPTTMPAKLATSSAPSKKEKQEADSRQGTDSRQGVPVSSARSAKPHASHINHSIRTSN